MASFVDYQEDYGSAFKLGTAPVASVSSSERPNFTAAFQSDSRDDGQRCEDHDVFVCSSDNCFAGIAKGLFLSFFLWVGTLAFTYVALKINF